MARKKSGVIPLEVKETKDKMAKMEAFILRLKELILTETIDFIKRNYLKEELENFHQFYTRNYIDKALLKVLKNSLNANSREKAIYESWLIEIVSPRIALDLFRKLIIRAYEVAKLQK